jgi:hypothetical protein
LTKSRAFLEEPELAAAVEMRALEQFAKRIALLKSRACRRVRTKNHVERVNRKNRHQEKARSKWRRQRTIVRFVVSLLDRYWREEQAIRSRWREEPQRSEPSQRLSGKKTLEIKGNKSVGSLAFDGFRAD